MSGIFGGNEKTKNQTSTTTVNPYPAAKPGLDQFYGDLLKTYQQGGLYQSPYMGDTVAPVSPETAQAWQGTSDRATAGSDLNRASQSQIMARLDPNYLSTQSPELQAIIDQGRQGVNAEFARGGRTFSGAHAGGLAQSSGQLRFQDLLRKSGEQMSAIGMAPGAAREDYYDLQQLGGVGDQRQAQLQDLINAEINRFNALQGGKANELGMFSQLLQGGGPSGSSTTQPVTTNKQNSILGGLSGIAGIASLFL